MINKLPLIYLLLVFCACTSAPKPGQLGHSHNDYYQERPFFTAYENYFGSIEVDIWAVDGELYVAHDKEEIDPDKTIESMYLQPVIDVFRENGGKAWNDTDDSFILLVDLKTSYSPALDILVEKISAYPEVFDPGTNPNAVRVVISGAFPPPELFDQYPSYIWFDGRIFLQYDDEQIERVMLFSDHFRKYSSWDGHGEIPENDREKLLEHINLANDRGKKTRFWAAPDHEAAWRTLLDLGVGYVNTDLPESFAAKMSGK
jgi:alkaline phosphatase